MNLLAYKKIFISSIVGVVLIGGAYLVSTNSPAHFAYTNTSSEGEGTVTLKQLIGKDSDGDGVKDWEEALWGTDPKSADTDKDGTPDASEIAALRQAAGLPEPGETTGIAEDINETDVFAREIFAATLALKQSGELNEDSIQSLAASMLGSFATATIETFYTENDLAIAPEGKSAAKTYGEKLSIILRKYVPYDLGGELAILAKAFETENEEELRNLENYVHYYERLGEDTVRIAVPRGAMEAHLLAANSYRGMAKALTKMKYFFQNPLIGFTAFTEYLIYEQNAGNALLSLENYFKSGSF